MSEPEQQSADWIERASKGSAVIVVALYAIGYLITSLNLAKYGMGLSDPLKPKIIGAGVLFSLFCVLPVYVFHYTLLSVVTSPDADDPKASEVNFFNGMYSLTTATIAAGLLATGLAPLLTYEGPLSHWRLYLLIILFFIDIILSTWVRLASSEAVRKRLLLLGFAFGGVFFAYVSVLLSLLTPSFWLSHGHPFNRLHPELWLVACCVYFYALKPPVKQEAGYWVKQSVQFIFPLFIFATFIYPHVKSEWGGGAAFGVVLSFSKTSDFLPSKTISCQLLDENDRGVYISLSGKQTAVFVPRSSIGAMSYSADIADLPK